MGQAPGLRRVLNPPRRAGLRVPRSLRDCPTSLILSSGRLVSLPHSSKLAANARSLFSIDKCRRVTLKFRSTSARGSAHAQLLGQTGQSDQSCKTNIVSA